MKIKRCAVKVIDSDGRICWLAGFLDADRIVPLFSVEPHYFPVRHALDFSVQLRRSWPIVRLVPLQCVLDL